MEGVGARLGRSSTRYGPATVFTGPVRKWKKKWIHVTPPNSANSSSNDKHHHHHHQQQNHQSNGNSSSSSSNGNNVDSSHLLVYKWTPISQSHNNSSSANDNSNGDAKDDADAGEVEEEPPRRKMKYIPIAVLEEQNNEAAEVQTDEPKSTETGPHTTSDPSLKDEKPDINDVPIEENKEVCENMEVEREDVKKSSSNSGGLSLNLNASDGEEEEEEEESEEAKDQRNGDVDRNE